MFGTVFGLVALEADGMDSSQIPIIPLLNSQQGQWQGIMGTIVQNNWRALNHLFMSYRMIGILRWLDQILGTVQI